MIISNVQSTCGCTVPTKPTEPIMPGMTGKIDVKYTLVYKVASATYITVSAILVIFICCVVTGQKGISASYNIYKGRYA